MYRGMQLDKEKGYSVYYFGDKESDYCVIDQDDEYYQQRLNMNVGSIVLVVCIMLAIPLIFVAVHDNFCKKMKKNKNMLFFVWSTLVIAASFALPILILDVSTITSNILLYPASSFNDIYIYFILFICLIGVLLVFNLVTLAASLAYLKKHKKTTEKFPVPEVLKFFSNLIRRYCCCCNKCKTGETGGDSPKGIFTELCCSDCIVLLIAMYFFMLFLQLMSFHSVYIVLGTIATPVKTLSLTTFYIALFFSLVAFIAVFLKATNDINFNQRCEWHELICITMKCLLPLLAVGLFAACAFFFVRYFSNYLTVIQGSNNSVGILSVLGSILPSALIGLAGFCGTRIMNCIGTNNEEEEKLKHQLSSLLERLIKEENGKASGEAEENDKTSDKVKRLKEENDKASAEAKRPIKGKDDIDSVKEGKAAKDDGITVVEIHQHKT